MSTSSEVLHALGLEPASALVFTYLVENGEQGATALQTNTHLSKAGLYDALNSLLAREFVTYRKNGRTAFYTAVHPSKLLGLIEERKRATDTLAASAEEVIRSLTGSYNLHQNQPGVRYFEGVEGIREVLQNSLRVSGSTILTIGDLEMWVRQFASINDAYVATRKEKKIRKRAITDDRPFHREFLKSYDRSLTDTRLLTNLPQPFANGIVEIYEDKVAYITFRNSHLVGVIIQDPVIHAMHVAFFEFMWRYAHA